MKTFFLTLTSVTLAVLSFNVWADKITITGQPIVVERQGDFYVAPTTVTPDEKYYYFNIDNTRRVCYRETNPDLVNVSSSTYKVKFGDSVTSLYCYTYSPDYFVVGP